MNYYFVTFHFNGNESKMYSIKSADKLYTGDFLDESSKWLHIKNEYVNLNQVTRFFHEQVQHEEYHYNEDDYEEWLGFSK